MDWQQFASLMIVGVTALMFLRARLRARKGGLACSSGCGCASSRTSGPLPSVIFRARKGERPQVMAKHP